MNRVSSALHLSAACLRAQARAASRVGPDGRDLGIVFYTIFKQNVLESLEGTKVVL